MYSSSEREGKPCVPPPSRGRLGGGWAAFCIPQSAFRNFLSLFSLIGKGFVDQHDGNIVFNGIEKATSFADQAVSFAIQKNISFAFRTSQNFQQLFTEWHRHLLCLYLPIWLPVKNPLNSFKKVLRHIIGFDLPLASEVFPLPFAVAGED